MGDKHFVHSSVLAQLKALQSGHVFRNTPEVTKPVEVTLKGQVPHWLSGILYRIGPAKYNLGDEGGKQVVIQHAFDGLPFVHRFEISAGQQTLKYNSKHIAEGLERTLLSSPQKPVSEIWFGFVPEGSLLSRVRGALDRIFPSLFGGDKPTDPDYASSKAVGVTVTPNYPLPPSWQLGSADQAKDRVLVTKTDANLLQHLDAETLEPHRLFTYAGYNESLSGQVSAAHHQQDIKTGEIFNFTYLFGTDPGFTVFSINKAGETTVLAKITHRLLPGHQRSPVRASYIHSFWLTENYIILPETPLHYNMLGLNILMTGNLTASMAWESDSPAYLHVISRKPNVGLIISLPVDPFFTFHVANGWDTVDDQGNAVLELDCAAAPDGDFLYQLNRYNQLQRSAEAAPPPEQQYTKVRGMTMPPMPNPHTFGDLRRYRVTWNANHQGEATFSTLATNIEFPRFSQDYNLKPNQFVWACRTVAPTDKHPEHAALVKVDTSTGHVATFDGGNLSCSEPIFVPRPGATREDDGAIVSFANAIHPTDPDQDRCLLLVLDAQTMQELARADIGPFAATTFHGSFVDQYFESVSLN